MIFLICSIATYRPSFFCYICDLSLLIHLHCQKLCVSGCVHTHARIVHGYMHCCKYDVSMHTLIKLLVKIKQYSKTLFTAKYSKTSDVFIVGSGSRCDYKQFCLNAVNYVMIHLSSESQ